MATDRFNHAAEELSAYVDAFWRTGDGVDQHYVVIQTTILRAGNVLARCSRYESDDRPRIVNVGACQGADQDGMLFGLSLQK